MNFWDKLKSLSALYEKLSEPVREQYHLTQLEYDIIMFLHDNPEYNISNDIVKVRKLAKSHVSTSVASLEEKGLLLRSSTPYNRKSIRLSLTPAAYEIVSAGMDVQAAYGDILFRGFSDAEKEQFRELSMRMCDNAEADLSNRK